MKIRAHWLLLAAVLTLAACASIGQTTPPPRTATAPPATTAPATPATATATPGTITQIADEGTVTYSVTLHPGQCHVRDSGKLPDPACTPGAVDPAVTQATIRQTICVRGWTKTVRPPASETDKAKFDVAYPAYSLPAGTTSELDHLIPLELGGANDITNLWPEAGSVPNTKDPVEDDLRADVCAGELTLTQARQAIAANWETVP